MSISTWFRGSIYCTTYFVPRIFKVTQQSLGYHIFDGYFYFSFCMHLSSLCWPILSIIIDLKLSERILPSNCMMKNSIFYTTSLPNHIYNTNRFHWNTDLYVLFIHYMYTFPRQSVKLIKANMLHICYLEPRYNYAYSVEPTHTLTNARCRNTENVHLHLKWYDLRSVYLGSSCDA